MRVGATVGAQGPAHKLEPQPVPAPEPGGWKHRGEAAWVVLMLGQV